MDNTDESVVVSGEWTVLDGQSEPAMELDADRAQLLMRLLIGALVAGGGTLVQRLEDLQEEILADPGLLRRDAYAEVETSRDALRYMAIALLIRGEKRVANGIRSGYNLSLDTARWVLRRLDRLTDNRLARPARRRVAARTRTWGQEAALLVEEGKREEQISKVLAAESVGLLIDEVMDYVAENPELDRLIAELVGQKSAGLATVVVDNTRSLTAMADDVTEGVLRRLLRRRPRRALPPSPLEGKPQRMYAPETVVEGVDVDDG
jgi:hypothetical protein